MLLETIIPEKMLPDTTDVELLRTPLVPVPHIGAGAIWMSGVEAAMQNAVDHSARQPQQWNNVLEAFIYLPSGNKIEAQRWKQASFQIQQP